MAALLRTVIGRGLLQHAMGASARPIGPSTDPPPSTGPSAPAVQGAMTKMRRLFLWLGCAAILERCPRAERMRAAATGAGVLVVAVLAALSATVTAYQFLHVPVPGAVLLGAGWGQRSWRSTAR